MSKRLIIWKPEFEEFFYEKLKQHATATYLWREEFIFELEHVVVVEVPQAGRASYVFKKSAVMNKWLGFYIQTSRAEIRLLAGPGVRTLRTGVETRRAARNCCTNVSELRAIEHYS